MCVCISSSSYADSMEFDEYWFICEWSDTQVVFVARPTKRASMAQGLFMVGPGAGP